MSLTNLQSQESLSKVVTQVVSTNSPQVIFDKNEPMAVVLDYRSYVFFLSLMDELEEKGRYLDAKREGQNKKGISLESLKKKYQLS